MAAKILANIIIAGAGVLLRAGSQAWRQAIINGQKAGMTPESIKNATSNHKITLDEAQKILGVESGATLKEIMERYNHLFDVNEKHGYFYLQSKIFRAKERLEVEFGPSEEREADQPKPDKES